MRQGTFRPGRALNRSTVLSALLFALTACSGDNLFSGGGGGGPTGGGAVPLADSAAPYVRFQVPEDSGTFTRGEPIRVSVQVRDSASGIRSLTLRGVTFRGYGDPLSNVTEVLKYPDHVVSFPQGPQSRVPLDTVLTRDLMPNADTASEPVWVIATARDTAGNTSADTIFLRPGPRIEIIEPVAGDRAGGGMRLQVRAIDPVVGLSSVRVELSGSVTAVIVRPSLNGMRTPLVIDTMIALPATAGTVSVRAVVVNWQELADTAGPVVVNFTAQVARDSVAPQVSRQLYTHANGTVRGLRDRVELGDTLRVLVRADDANGSGIAELGAVIRVFRTDDSIPDHTLLRNTVYATPRPGAVEDTFEIVLKDLYDEIGASAVFPQRVGYEIHAYAYDAANPRNCGASVRETPDARQCAPAPGAPGGQQAVGVVGQRYVTDVVVGTSLPLPANSVIADMLPDTTPGRERLYMSNWARNQVEVLTLGDTTFRPSVLVGSQPWGLFLVPGGATDTLMVANSGGTSISFVPTDNLREDSPRRLLTPNDALFEIRETVSGSALRYSVSKLEFSDRPQFVAQDRNKVILYSTQPTSAATEGTIRLALSDPTPSIPNDPVRPEVKIIFGREAIAPSDAVYAVARVDSIFVVPGYFAGSDAIRICDHQPGRPANAFCRIGRSWEVLAQLDAMPADSSDIFYDRGTWDRAVVGLNDTTYVSYSKDLSTIAFGEGAAAPYGRVILYDAAPVAGAEGRVASQGTADLIGNAAERVLGVALNVDGTFGVARGLTSAYFFSNNAKLEGPLRLQGVFSDGVTAGNGGVALHPHHGTIAAGRDATTLAFIATSQRSIRILDTFHYFELGEIPVRENVVGQLRAAPPLPGVNNGLTPNHCDYTIAHLYGVSAEGASGPASARRILMLNVRVRHLTNDPTRPACTP